MTSQAYLISIYFLSVSMITSHVVDGHQGENDRRRDHSRGHGRGHGHEHMHVGFGGKFDSDDGEIVNPLRRSDFAQHKEFLIQHLATSSDEEKEVSENEMNFLFFQSHDEDRDGKLDGLELYQSTLQTLYDQTDAMQLENYSAEQLKLRMEKMTERIIRTVDQILLEDDRDGDGFISYAEFGSARLAATTLRAFDDLKKKNQ